MPPFTTLLVANRGEIACRVIRTAHRLGYRTVAVTSDADRGSPHVRLADRAVHIGPANAAESYLDGARLLDAARRAGADAIHPGYGFLSENAAFARSVLDAGLVWVGPPPDAIAAMGDKARSKQHMRRIGVSCIPGFDEEDPSDDTLLASAAGVGFPLLVKASAGGGGRGMRRVYCAEDLPEALRSARAEAEGAFGSGRLLLERLVTNGRHVEVQVYADTHGSVIHLGERDCSVQRRHQKVIEEAPSPVVDVELRARMGDAACAAARAVGYAGAGTVEFLLEGRSFYFLEMNTRLQVEHAVTEAITGLDLVEWQLRVASGERLPLTQEQVQFHGHAIEARLYAEDPGADWLPQAGPIRCFRPPSPADGVRVDHGVGQEISSFYDPMVAKVVGFGADREEARRRLVRALDHTVLLGIRTNQAFLTRVLEAPGFVAGAATTAFLDEHDDVRLDPPRDPATAAIAAALYASGTPQRGAVPLGFRNSHAVEAPVCLSFDGDRLDAYVLFGVHSAPSAEGSSPIFVRIHDTTHRVQLHGAIGLDLRVSVDGVERTVHAVEGEPTWIRHGREVVRVAPWDPAPSPDAAVGDAAVRAPTAGRVLWVAEVGAEVAVGARVAVVEAMKLETPVRARRAGIVRSVRVAVGSNVSAGQLLATIEEP